MLATLTNEDSYDLDIADVLRRAELKWSFEHDASRKFTRGSITSLWPGGVDDFRQYVVVKRYLHDLEDDDRVLSALAGRIRRAQRSSQRQTQREDLKVAIAEYARDLLADRLNRPFALLYFRTLLDRPSSTATQRLELELGLEQARRRALPYFERVTTKLQWRTTSPEALYVAVTGLVDGLLLQWAVRRDDDSDVRMNLAFAGALALCNGLEAEEPKAPRQRARPRPR
jgi:hypothetical protein